MFDRLLSTVNALPALVAYLDTDLRYVFVNEAHRGWRGLTPEFLLGKHVWEIVPPETTGLIAERFAEALAGIAVCFELDLGDGDECFELFFAPDFDGAGRVIGVIAEVSDLTARKQVERDLRRSERTFDGAFRTSAVGKAITGPEGICMRANESLSRLLGYSMDELVGCDFRRLSHPDDRPLSRAAFASIAAGEGDSYQLEKRFIHREGHNVHALVCVSAVREDDGTPLRFVIEIADITERKAQQELLRHEATTDHLTGLLNRRGFDEAVGIAIEDAERRDLSLAVLMVDLDHFKPVNDRFGHATGDAVLVEVASRISRHVRSSDRIARLGGDEFAVLLLDARRSQVERAAERLVEALSLPFVIDGITINAGASVGAAFRDDRLTTARELLRRADDELYLVKGSGRGRWQMAG